MRSHAPLRANSHLHSESNSEQEPLNFSPIEFTPEEREQLRKEILKWTLEEAAEEFHPLPGESITEFFEARAAYLHEIKTFGPLFFPQPSAAWEIVQGRGRPPPPQLALPFEEFES